MKTYFVWKSHTCWVCSGGGYDPPHYHACESGRQSLTSPCDTVGKWIEAPSRAAAIRIYAGKARRP